MAQSELARMPRKPLIRGAKTTINICPCVMLLQPQTSALASHSGVRTLPLSIYMMNDVRGRERKREGEREREREREWARIVKIRVKELNAAAAAQGR